MKWVVSSLPGRLRLRDRALRDPDRLERLRAALARLDGMLAVEGNPATGSLLLRYDVTRTDRATLEAQVVAAVAAAAAVVAAPAGDPPAAVSRRAVARRLNSYAKVGMLGSLGVSLALAAAGNKRLHAATGGLFTAFLAIHMAVHRRHLLK